MLCLVVRMRQHFPNNKVSYENSFYFNQYDISPYESDKIGWVYIEGGVLENKLAEKSL